MTSTPSRSSGTAASGCCSRLEAEGLPSPDTRRGPKLNFTVPTYPNSLPCKEVKPKKFTRKQFAKLRLKATGMSVNVAFRRVSLGENWMSALWG